MKCTKQVFPNNYYQYYAQCSSSCKYILVLLHHVNNNDVVDNYVSHVLLSSKLDY